MTTASQSKARQMLQLIQIKPEENVDKSVPNWVYNSKSHCDLLHGMFEDHFLISEGQHTKKKETANVLHSLNENNS